MPFGALLPAFLYYVARRVGLDDVVARRISPYHLQMPFLHSVNVLNACVEVNGPLDHVTAHHNAGVPVFVAALPGAVGFAPPAAARQRGAYLTLGLLLYYVVYDLDLLDRLNIDLFGVKGGVTVGRRGGVKR